MSLILKGIDLPKEGSRMVEIYPDGTASADLGNFYPDMIEAIQIPTPHGRLIDADKVFCYDFMDEQNIDNAPTILEAEEEYVYKSNM